MITFERINIDSVPWASIESIGEINVFHTQAWIDFIVETQQAEPVIAAVKSDGNLIGYFTGLIVKKFGLKILGSPFRGWATYFMGFNLLPGISYHEVLQAFPKFVFGDLGCQYFEMVDPNLRREECDGLPYKVEALPWFEIDLSPSLEQLFQNIKDAGRRNIRKAMKCGLVIEEASAEGFAEEYYAEYSEVLKYKGLAPTYSLESVKKMIECLKDTGNILLVQARNAEGLRIATAIFLALNKRSVYWGGASWHEYRNSRPNEPLFWHAMQALKARGIADLQMGGEAEEFKRKLGSQDSNIFRIMKAKYSLIDMILNIVTSPRGTRFKNYVLRKL